MDCQDSNCAFAENTNGMRTNGGCRCIDWEHITPNDRVKLRAFLREVRDLRKDLAIMARMYQRACDAQEEAQRERDALRTKGGVR